MIESVHSYVDINNNVKGNLLPEEQETNNDVEQEPDSENQRIELYIEVIKSVFYEKNSGGDFIAVKTETLEGLNSKQKTLILEGLKELSPNVYDFEDKKRDETKLNFGKDDSLEGTINGTLLWIELEEYVDNKALITGTSWFGNLASASFNYDAHFESGSWKLNIVYSIIS